MSTDTTLRGLLLRRNKIANCRVFARPGCGFAPIQGNVTQDSAAVTFQKYSEGKALRTSPIPQILGKKNPRRLCAGWNPPRWWRRQTSLYTTCCDAPSSFETNACKRAQYPLLSYNTGRAGMKMSSKEVGNPHRRSHAHDVGEQEIGRAHV